MPQNIYDALGNSNLKKVFEDIIAASAALGVDFFGVGALVQNIWYLENNKMPRGTKDIDFGVYMPDERTYSDLKFELINEYGYVQAENNAFCLISPDGIQLDLLPFGEIENDGKVMIEGKGLIDISLDGFVEVYKNGLRSVDIDSQTIKVCSIPAVVLLKLIAFDDRPEQRYKDPLDISSVMKHYHLLEDALIWEEYNRFFDGDLDSPEIGIMVIGCEMRKITKNNLRLHARINDILDRGIQLSSSLAVRMIVSGSDETVEEKQNLLKLLKKGLNETVC